MVRGRLVAINEKPVSAASYENDRARRMVDREFNLSYASMLPASNEMLEGRWLDPDRNEVSLEIEIGRAHVGTQVTNAHLVCRLLLEKKKNIKQKYTI